MTEEKKNKFIEAILEDDKPWLLITHDNCMDGTGCVLACWYTADNTQIQRPEVITMQYSTNVVIPDVTGKNVMIADFSFDRETLIEMEQKANSLVVIDHHESAKNQLDGLDFCHFDMEHSGAILTYQFLLPTSGIPSLLQYIEDRDIWKWKLPNTKEVSAYLTLFSPKDYDTFYAMINDSEFATGASTAGKILLQYQQKTIDKVAKTDFKLVKWGKYEVPLVNTTTLISEIGNELAKQYPFAVMFFITQTEIVFSFRSVGDFNLTKLAVPKGHPNAAGRSIDICDRNLDLNDLFNTYDGYDDLGLFLMKLFNDPIDIETYYDVYNNEVVDLENNSYDYVIFNDAKIRFKNKLFTYLGCDIRINYIRKEELWKAGIVSGAEIEILAAEQTYSEVVDSIKEAIECMVITTENYVTHVMTHKGFSGSINYENETWYGKLLNIEGLVTYESAAFEDLRKEFIYTIYEYQSLLNKTSVRVANDNSAYIPKEGKELEDFHNTPRYHHIDSKPLIGDSVSDRVDASITVSDASDLNTVFLPYRDHGDTGRLQLNIPGNTGYLETQGTDEVKEALKELEEESDD